MMGSEPIYISATDLTAPEWQIAALGADQRQTENCVAITTRNLY
jgi:uncharacterized protein (DUF2126 family)